MSSVTATDPLAAYRQTTPSAKTAESTEDRFLTLLISQLKNQDPLNPLDNAQVTTQMAQINTVKGIEDLNQTLNLMMGRVQNNEELAALSAVGRQAVVPGDVIALYNGQSAAGFELPQGADEVTVKVYDSAGNVLHSVNLGKQEAGVHLFAWDGKTDSGQTAVNNVYRFEVEAVAAKQKINADTLSIGRIDGVVNGEDEVTFNLGGLPPVKLSDIRQFL